MFHIAQSFYVDPQSVLKAETIFITSIDLFIQKVVSPQDAGIPNPGMTIFLTSVQNGRPLLSPILAGYQARVEYSQLNVDPTSQTATKFTFNRPIPVKTDSTYAFLIKFDCDTRHILAANRAGELDQLTDLPTKVSAGRVDGNLFEITNGFDVTALNDTDLKFKINIARFNNSYVTYKLTNRAFEFFDLVTDSISGEFIGGEYVYRAQANLVGTASFTSGSANVTGTGTSFLTEISNNSLIVIGNVIKTVNVVSNDTFLTVTSSFSTTNATANVVAFEAGLLDLKTGSNTVIGTGTKFQTSGVAVGKYIVITDGTKGNTEVRRVVGVSSETQIELDVKPSFSNSSASWFFAPIGKVDNFKAYNATMILDDSSANSSMYFQANDLVRGVDSTAECAISEIKDMNLTRFATDFNLLVPSYTKVEYFVNFSNSTYGTSSTNQQEIKVFDRPFLSSYEAKLNSRSNEVVNSAGLFSNAKSFSSELIFSSSNPYSSPLVDEENLDFKTYEVYINSNSYNEAYSNGAAHSRYLSRTVSLKEDQIAEDLIVYLDAYRPEGTDIEVYARILSEEDVDSFEDKNWTKMELSVPTGSQFYSVDANPNDIIEYKYTIPYYHSGTAVTSGTFQTISGNSVVTGSYSTVNTNITSGMLVKIYNPSIPEVFLVDTVVASNTTTFTVSGNISNNDVVGAGLNVDVISEKNSAFLNNQNYNVVRYFNKNMSKFDGFKNFAIKIVLLSNSYSKIPRVQNYRAIAVSA